MMMVAAVADFVSCRAQTNFAHIYTCDHAARTCRAQSAHSAQKRTNCAHKDRQDGRTACCARVYLQQVYEVEDDLGVVQQRVPRLLVQQELVESERRLQHELVVVLLLAHQVEQRIDEARLHQRARGALAAQHRDEHDDLP